MKKYWELAELESGIFWGGHFEFSTLAISNFFFFISVKNPFLLSFFSALWMVFPEYWKRNCPIFYAHDCTYKWYILKDYLISLTHIYTFKNFDPPKHVWTFWNCRTHRNCVSSESDYQDAKKERKRWVITNPISDYLSSTGASIAS